MIRGMEHLSYEERLRELESGEGPGKTSEQPSSTKQGHCAFWKPNLERQPVPKSPTHVLWCVTGIFI